MITRQYTGFYIRFLGEDPFQVTRKTEKTIRGVAIRVRGAIGSCARYQPKNRATKGLT